VAVKLRLMRLGRKGQPFYRIVAVDSRKRRDGAYIEKIGHYNPLRRPAEVVVDDDKALKWLSRGAQPSDTVRNLFSRQGIMLAFHLQKKGFKEEEIRDQVARFRFEKEEKLKAREEEAILAHAEKLTEVASPKAEIDEGKAAVATDETAAEPEPIEAVTESESTDIEPEAVEAQAAPDASDAVEESPAESTEVVEEPPSVEETKTEEPEPPAEEVKDEESEAASDTTDAKAEETKAKEEKEEAKNKEEEG
jgi:small subunit ribosomal protein S16